MRKMFDLDQEIKGAKRIGIAGHIRPGISDILGGPRQSSFIFCGENYPEPWRL